MRTITFTRDVQKIRGRFVSCLQFILLGGVMVTLGGTVMSVPPPTSFEPLLLLAGSALSAGAIIAAVFLWRRMQPGGHTLTLDADGLRLSQRGQVRRWSWPDMSPATRHGRFATFDVHDGVRRSEVRIDDVYMTPLAEILRRIDDYRKRAGEPGTATIEADAQDAGLTAPAVIHARTDTLRPYRRRILLVTAGVVPVCIAVYATLWTRLDFIHSELGPGIELWILALLAIVFCVFLVQFLLISGRHGNLLLVTDEGLAWANRSLPVRQWRWRDLSAFEIRDGGAGKPVGSRAIAFTAADDGKFFQSMKFAGLPWARATTSGLLSFTVDDVYGLPIDKLGALLNAARDRALADTPQSQALENSMTAGLARDGRALGFQKNPARIGAVGWAVTIAGFAWVLLAAVVFLGWPSDVAVDMEGWAHSPGQWLQRFAVLLVPIALIAELLILMREIMPADNALTLDRDGLTLIRGGSKKAWPWRDLTGFEVTFREVLGLFGPRGVIVFGTPGGRDLRSRFLRWCYRLSGRAPAMVLEDIYDTPLDDIAATLNRYRAEGAGGGAAD